MLTEVVLAQLNLTKPILLLSTIVIWGYKSSFVYRNLREFAFASLGMVGISPVRIYSPSIKQLQLTVMAWRRQAI
jgi:hypothetical protein